MRRPTWKDRRLIVGAVLVLGSTVIGARLLGAPEGGTTVWSARHDLPAGVAVRADDLVPRHVRLDAAASRYVAATSSVPSGLVLARGVGAGELVPLTALAPAGTRPDVRVVTLPVERFHVAEDLARGERVDVYVTATAGAAARVLATAVTVVDVEQDGGRFGGSGATRGVAVAVPSRSVATLVGGLADGTVDVVRVDGAAS